MLSRCLIAAFALHALRSAQNAVAQSFGSTNDNIGYIVANQGYLDLSTCAQTCVFCLNIDCWSIVGASGCSTAKCLCTRTSFLSTAFSTVPQCLQTACGDSGESQAVQDTVKNYCSAKGYPIGSVAAETTGATGSGNTGTTAQSNPNPIGTTLTTSPGGSGNTGAASPNSPTTVTAAANPGQTAGTNTNNASNDNKGLTAGEIAGIVAPILTIVGAIMTIGWKCHSKKKERAAAAAEEQQRMVYRY